MREGVRRLEEVLALAREVEACPGCACAACHAPRPAGGFLPIVAALRSNVSQARLPAPESPFAPCALSALLQHSIFMVLLTSNTYTRQLHASTHGFFTCLSAWYVTVVEPPWHSCIACSVACYEPSANKD